MTTSPTQAYAVALMSHEGDGVRLESAARHLEQSLQVGTADPQVLYMLAMVRKRQGRIAEARNALRKIVNPDTNVLTQMGLLSLQERQLVQAEQEFTKAWEMDSSSYAAGYNLMLTQLSQGKLEASLSLVRQLHQLAPAADKRQLLGLMELLLDSCTGKTGQTSAKNLATISATEEQQLLELIVELGQMEAMFPLLRTLAVSRPESQTAQHAFAAGVLMQAKLSADRCHWDVAGKLLEPLANGFKEDSPALRIVGQELRTAVYNLLGCCLCMLQEYDHALEYFSLAAQLLPNDPWLHQNLALAWELKGEIDAADGHWNRYFDLQGRAPMPLVANYREDLAFEGLNRLSEVYSKNERWNTALTYLQRACRARPIDFDALERLFHMYNQVKRPQDASRTLQKLRELRPNDPQLELYDLDLREVKSLPDIEKMLAEIRQALAKHPGDTRVEEKAAALVGNFVPLIGRMFNQYADQLKRVVDQMRRLPHHQVNWSAVHEVMRDLQKEFQKLRRIAGRCLSLTTSEEHRRALKDLMQQIDTKLDVCQQSGA